MCLLAPAEGARTSTAAISDATKGTACGAVVRTCGLCPRVRLNRPVDAPGSRRGRRNLHTDGLPAEGREHPSEPLLQLDLRLPAEHLLRPRDVRLADLWIVDRERLVHDLARRAGDAEDGLRELVERELARVPDVHRQVLSALREA